MFIIYKPTSTYNIVRSYTFLTQRNILIRYIFFNFFSFDLTWLKLHGNFPPWKTNKLQNIIRYTLYCTNFLKLCHVVDNRNSTLVWKLFFLHLTFTKSWYSTEILSLILISGWNTNKSYNSQCYVDKNNWHITDKTNVKCYI